MFCWFSIFISIAALTLSFIQPSDGFGITVCWFKGLSAGLPCPGCGMMRSLSCISHMQFTKAFLYHPFGFGFYVLFLVSAAFLILPGRTRPAIINWAESHNGFLLNIYWGFVTGFIVFGVTRTVTAMVTHGMKGV